VISATLESTIEAVLERRTIPRSCRIHSKRRPANVMAVARPESLDHVSRFSQPRPGSRAALIDARDSNGQGARHALPPTQPRGSLLVGVGALDAPSSGDSKIVSQTISYAIPCARPSAAWYLFSCLTHVFHL
jgi:hypothetical protein